MTLLLLLLGAPALAEDDADSTEAPSAEAGVLRSDRLEFDERMVRGQTASAGAVYLFQRAPRALPALVGPRTEYRAQIVGPLLGAERALAPVTTATTEDADADASGGQER